MANRYRGTAGDVVGEALGEVQGNALNWQYTLQVPVDGKVWDITLDDWLFLIDENNLINRTKLRKFGLPVGELTLHIRKLSETETAAFSLWKRRSQDCSTCGPNNGMTLLTSRSSRLMRHLPGTECKTNTL